MAKKFTTVNTNFFKNIITYDLRPCNISSSDICAQEPKFFNYFQLEKTGYYDLPNTTIRTNLEVKEAEEAFKRAVRLASNNTEKITKLLIVKVGSSCYIENDI